MGNKEEKAVLLEKKDGVAWLTINRAEKRNAINMAVATQMAEHLEGCRTDRELRAIVITAAGDVAFCAGNDLTEFKERSGDPVKVREFDQAVLKMQEGIRTFPKVVMAVVNGFCLGGGITLLGACDLALASDKAEFGLPEVSRGTYPALATTTLMHTLHRKHAFYLILTGKRISAQEAMVMGLINKVVPQAELTKVAEEWAQTFAGYNPEVLEWAKKIAYDSLRMDYERSLEYGLFASQTFRGISRFFDEGIGTFLKKGS